MFPANKQSPSAPEKASYSSTSPVRPPSLQINTDVPLAADSKHIEVIEILSSASPQETHPQPSQSLPATGTPEGRQAQSQLKELPITPSSFPAPSGQPAPHSIFKLIKIHTAKCDICNKHNKATLQRCIECGWQICTPCWNARGGNGAHGSVRKFTGAIYRSSDDEQPLKKPRKKGKNAESGTKSTTDSTGKAALTDVASTPARSGVGNEPVKGESSVILGGSTVNAAGSPGQVPTTVTSSKVILQEAQGSSKMEVSNGQSGVKLANSHNDHRRRSSISNSQVYRTPGTSDGVVDDISSSSSLTSLSALEEDCGYRGDEEDDDDDDATEFDPDSEDVIMAGGKAYQKRPFRDLTPEAETRMNWLLIAAEEALQERDRERERSKAGNGNTASVPVARSAQPPAPASAPAPSPTPPMAPGLARAPVAIPIRGPLQVQKRRAFTQPATPVSSMVSPAVPVSELIPAVPMEIDPPRSASNPPAPQHPTRKPFYQLDVPLGLRGILPGTHTFRDSRIARALLREMREAEALIAKKAKEDLDREENRANRRATNPHARAWEL